MSNDHPKRQPLAMPSGHPDSHFPIPREERNALRQRPSRSRGVVMIAALLEGTLFGAPERRI
jgi:hypothetical protein